MSYVPFPFIEKYIFIFRRTLMIIIFLEYKLSKILDKESMLNFIKTLPIDYYLLKLRIT